MATDIIDDQDIFDLDMDRVVPKLLGGVDEIRSKTPTDGFIESRVNAFYRMIGFPVVQSASEYFSPGYDVNINRDLVALSKHNSIINGVLKNNQLINKQLEPRELIPKYYSRVFSAGGFNAKAFAFGSVFIRSFEKQFGSTGPLEEDNAQTQTVSQRVSNVIEFFSRNSEQAVAIFNLISSPNFQSNHPLKPFIVDPRVVVTPDARLVAAPFLLDASQLQFGVGQSYKRPYIERVISIRLANNNVLKNNLNLTKIIDSIKKDETITHAFLVAVSKNPQKDLLTSNVVVFDSYFRKIRAVLDKLAKSIGEVLDARKLINFQPIPDPILGMEGNITLDAISEDPNNGDIELDILTMSKVKALKELALQTSTGLQGQPDPGDFVFSDLDDIFFSADQAVENSHQDTLDSLETNRQSIANPALEALKNIEYIMGEFSGLGILDIIAIQSAFWLMDMDKLLGLLDRTAYDRLVSSRPFINAGDFARSEDVFESLTHFETHLKEVYSLIQLYFNQIYTGNPASS